jgi:hypothetical protein
MLEKVGQGGSGQVFKVMGPKSRIFACKIMSLSNSDVDVGNCRSEVKLLQRMFGKPNIIQLFAAEEKEGHLFMVRVTAFINSMLCAFLIVCRDTLFLFRDRFLSSERLIYLAFFKNQTARQCLKIICACTFNKCLRLSKQFIMKRLCIEI